MVKSFSVLVQHITPQRTLTRLMSWLAQSRQPWIKNPLINLFIKRYQVEMSEAVIENPSNFPTFNDFFTRHLKPTFRPIAQGSDQIISPVDGVTSQIGKIDNTTLLQAKGHDYSLQALLGGSQKRAELFQDGQFATFYLAPKDYHRVHMPFSGNLRESIFIPGKLFSVCPQTAAQIPNLFARNERLVCIFDTEIGPMAVILIGAMIVGSIQTVWHANTTNRKPTIESYAGSISINKGAELGHFQLGSTVILLFAKDKMDWSAKIQPNSIVRMGSFIGKKKG